MSNQAAGNTSQTNFDESALSEFLTSGWMIGCDTETFLIGWGKWQESASPVKGLGRASLFAPDFYSTSLRPWVVTPHWDVVRRSRLATLFSSITALDVNRELDSTGASEHQLFQWVKPHMGDFSDAFQAIREGFETRGLKKAVPVVFESRSGGLGRGERLRILRKLIEAPKSLFPYGLWREDGKVSHGILGATPEALFSISRGDSHTRVKTMALAGTRVKGASAEDSAQSLFNDPKERLEHQIVVDDICDVLREFGDVHVGEISVVELPTLFHLFTPIEVESQSEIDFAKLSAKLHPTPALGLSPRALGFREMKLWDRSEDRQRFGAPFGISAQTIDGQVFEKCLVAIRNVQWSENETRIGSGCGVVPESQEDREWNELKLKRDSVKRLLDL